MNVQSDVVYPEKKESVFVKGMLDTFPVVASGIFDGIVYAVIARQIGLSWTETVALSLLVNGASSQFAALALMKQGVYGWPVVLSTLLINLRHIIYGISIGPYLKGTKIRTLMLAAFSLSDETYGVSIHRFQKQGGDIRYLLGSASLDYCLWQMSVMLGATIGVFSFNTFFIGLDFAFIGTFIGLLVMQIYNRSTLICFGLCAAVSVLVQWKFGSIAAIFAGAFTAVLYGGLKNE